MSPLSAAELLHPQRGRRRDLVVRWLAYALVLVITLIDSFTPAGIVVGMLQTIPVLLSSMGDEPGDVAFVSIGATLGLVVAATFGLESVTTAAFWIPNLIFELLAVVACSPLALILQRRRLEAEAARLRAERARDVSQLLQSLMAHDLRAPLALATEALQVADRALPGSNEAQLLREVEARLERSLATVDRVLEASRAALAEGAGQQSAPGGTDAAPAVRAPGGPAPETAGDDMPPDVAALVRELVRGYEEEARAQGKPLDLVLPAHPLRLAADATVLSQVLSILVENAIRHADPGRVLVSVSATARELLVSVTDSGPGYSQRLARPGANGGAGLGLKLSRVLAAKAGGTLTVDKDDPTGSEFVLRLPIRPASTRRSTVRLPRFRRAP